MRHIEWALAALDGLGLDADTRMHAAVTLFGYVRGQAVDLEPEARAERASGITGEQWMAAQQSRMAAVLASGALPHFAAAAPGAELSPGSLYAFGLAALLDGIAARIAGSDDS
ncbi:TetR/AcrR family transcriptional regulator C-terminal domain-containing protein [Streptomyces sp. NPDC046876]|uniref:TetR/AcrR family transcriptional regulator C-terminal domain-containing protein n=1 Tax=Streptomyces sp. NPDC046876 TaxID=3155616 RepID=UPI0033F66F95